MPFQHVLEHINDSGPVDRNARKIGLPVDSSAIQDNPRQTQYWYQVQKTKKTISAAADESIRSRWAWRWQRRSSLAFVVPFVGLREHALPSVWEILE